MNTHELILGQYHDINHDIAHILVWMIWLLLSHQYSDFSVARDHALYKY